MNERQPTAADALRTAADTKTDAHQFARSVLIVVDGRYTPAVVPADRTVDLAKTGRGFDAQIRLNTFVAVSSILAATIHPLLRYALRVPAFLFNLPLLIVLAIGGGFLIFDLLRRVLHGRFGSDPR